MFSVLEYTILLGPKQSFKLILDRMKYNLPRTITMLKKINVPTLHYKSCPMKGSVVCIKKLIYYITTKSLINFIV